MLKRYYLLASAMMLGCTFQVEDTGDDPPSIVVVVQQESDQEADAGYQGDSPVSEDSDANFTHVNKVDETVEGQGAGDSNLATEDDLQTTTEEDPESIQPLFQEEMDYGGAGEVIADFKIPLPGGYDWEVTQSWSSHCDICDAKYKDWSYCSELSHLANCCKHSWDFNLPGMSDDGKPVLASGDGTVKELYKNNSWGNTIVLQHDNGICTRYAHLLDKSTDHLSFGDSVCQGLKIGEIGNTGASEGSHLHFQFEDCNSGETLAMGFDDGNGIPVCTRGKDRYDSDGKYSFLKSTNTMRLECSPYSPKFSGAYLPLGAWYTAGCGALPDCPLSVGCNKNYSHQFSDEAIAAPETLAAAKYLFRECAIHGKVDGGLHPTETIIRAEALKVPIMLFGLNQKCKVPVNFEDTYQSSWYYPIVACGLKFGVVDNANTLFNPEAEVSFIEAAKFLVESAHVVGLLKKQYPQVSHFKKIPHSHWGYTYAETLYSYGAPVDLNVDPNLKISRGYYIRLAASLSPCYCPNVGCFGGCDCKQDVMACAGGEDKPELLAQDDVSVEEEPNSEIAGGSGIDEGETPEDETDQEGEEESVEKYEATVENNPDDSGDDTETVEDDTSTAEQSADPSGKMCSYETTSDYGGDKDINSYYLQLEGKGTLVSVLNGKKDTESFTLDSNPLMLKFEQKDLPVVLYIAKKSDVLKIDAMQKKWDGFHYWLPYEKCYYNLNPEEEAPPDAQTYGLEVHNKNLKYMLVKLPAKN